MDSTTAVSYQTGLPGDATAIDTVNKAIFYGLLLSILLIVTVLMRSVVRYRAKVNAPERYKVWPASSKVAFGLSLLLLVAYALNWFASNWFFSPGLAVN